MRRGGGTSGWVWAATGLLASALAGCVDDFPTVGQVGLVPADAAIDRSVDARALVDMRRIADAAVTDARIADAGPCLPGEESCNGVDDDCDGRIDEQQPRQTCVLTAGVCAGDSAGCLDGSYAPCDHGLANANFEAEETRCDGLDNDCDGITDEACACNPGETQDCGLAVGVCRAGIQVCNAGSFGVCDGAVEGGPEICNGLDDDCDGTTDEELPADEACDGLDNDCDGIIDEAVPPNPCPIDPDRPMCGEGETLCVNGETTCTSFEGRPDATCDAVDDDCDGRIDEDFSPAPCTAGACNGTVMCTAGVERCGLTPVDAADIGYNDIDEDCDGEIDEGPLTLYLEDLLVGGDGRRPGLPRGFVSGYDAMSVLGSGGFDSGASQAPAVDWVFRPSREDGGVRISSTALSHDFAADVDIDESATPPAKGPLTYAERPHPIDSSPHIIELPANIGVTFDLDAIRAMHPDRTLVRFRGRLGSSALREVRIKVLLDAGLHYESDCSPRDNANVAAIETITSTGLAGRRFLTFVALDCHNDSIADRHGFLFDARVTFGDRQ